ncbi:MAG: amino acid--tRNA ligase-related protein [Hyphomonadaceae bacterium]|nr:amino acid--tRNA ligase-related protein [Hyphomonadaceae bacterium]
MTTPAPDPWWSPPRHEDRRAFLHLRARMLAAIRAWFDAQGFIEADVGAWTRSPGAETHIHAFATEGAYLHTSPEFAMKRLLAAGERKLYFLGKTYRAGESGPLHAPEFTLLEWYRADAPYEHVMEDCVALARLASETAGGDALRWRGRHCNPFLEAERVRVHERAPRDLDSAAFSQRIVEIEPSLGHPRLTLLTHYPITEAALAQRCADDPTTAERFELYACGVELANGFGELTDAHEQRARLVEAMAAKRALYGEAWPIDEDFLAAVAQMPPASGCALGVDRLVLLAAGARDLRDVIWTPPP